MRRLLSLHGGNRRLSPRRGVLRHRRSPGTGRRKSECRVQRARSVADPFRCDRRSQHVAHGRASARRREWCCSLGLGQLALDTPAARLPAGVCVRPDARSPAPSRSRRRTVVPRKTRSNSASSRAPLLELWLGRSPPHAGSQPRHLSPNAAVHPAQPGAIGRGRGPARLALVDGARHARCGRPSVGRDSAAAARDRIGDQNPRGDMAPAVECWPGGRSRTVPGRSDELVCVSPGLCMRRGRSCPAIASGVRARARAHTPTLRSARASIARRPIRGASTRLQHFAAEHPRPRTETGPSRDSGRKSLLGRRAPTPMGCRKVKGYNLTHTKDPVPVQAPLCRPGLRHVLPEV
jgi:hypothetical protein